MSGYTAADGGRAPDVVGVIGAGAVGLTAALDLARSGAVVHVFDRGVVGDGTSASGRAAGLCYDAYAGPADARVAARALERFHEVAGGDDVALRECPYVWLAREGDERRATAVREGATAMADRGLDVSVFESDALGERFPRLLVDDVAVAAVAAGAATTDTTAYVEAMGTRAEAAGAELRTNVDAELSLEDGPHVVSERARGYDAVVVAAGARSPGVLADADVGIPVKPYRVQALVATDGYGEPICYDATGGFYVRPHPEGLLAGDGTEEQPSDPGRYDRAGDDWFVDDVRAGLQGRLGIDPAVDRAWAGLCTATPDGDPLVGAVRDGVYVATGFQGHGFMRAPAIGAAIADQVLGGEGIPGFDPGRFDGDEDFDIRQGMAIDESGRFGEA